MTTQWAIARRYSNGDVLIGTVYTDRELAIHRLTANPDNCWLVRRTLPDWEPDRDDMTATDGVVFLTTEEAMQYLGVKSALSIGVQPAHRGQPNLYKSSDLDRRKVELETSGHWLRAQQPKGSRAESSSL